MCVCACVRAGACVCVRAGACAHAGYMSKLKADDRSKDGFHHVDAFTLCGYQMSTFNGKMAPGN